MAKNKVYNIIRNGKKLENFELLKYAKLSSGYTVYLFRGTICPKVSNYIVCAKQGDVTVEFHQLMHHMRPFSMYLDLICCYA